MDDALLMCRRQSYRSLQGEVNEAAHTQWIYLEEIAQGVVLEKFRDQVVNSVLRAYVINGEKVGMVESAENSGLMLEALQTVWVGGQCGWQDFDRNIALQSCVSRAIDFAHPARTDDLIQPEFCATVEAHFFSSAVQ